MLPFVGSIMSKLFGTATVSDLTTIKQMLIKFGDTESQVIHVVSNSLTILNKTQVQVTENRYTINRLINVSTQLESELRNLYQTLKIDIEPEFPYLNCITRLHDIFHVVAVVQLQNQVNHALHGMMSLFVIRPSELRDTLKKIKNRLPKHRVLPFRCNDQSVLKYYKYLYPIIIPSGDKFLVILALPISAEESKFDIGEVRSVLVLKPSGNIVAYY